MASPAATSCAKWSRYVKLPFSSEMWLQKRFFLNGKAAEFRFVSHLQLLTEAPVRWLKREEEPLTQLASPYLLRSSLV
jgi:hypothetical protein